jgi:lipid II:glycine glycyltransferase (peptidoglycan interpeptide bridge formation enzyme)
VIRAGQFGPGCEIDQEALGATDFAGNDDVNDFRTGPCLHFQYRVGRIPTAGRHQPSNRKCLLPTVWDISLSRTRAAPAEVDSATGVSSRRRSTWSTWAVGRLDTVWSSELSATDAEAYDRFVAAARGGHYSQTRSWAKVATAARPFVARYFLARRDGRVVGAALILRTQALGVAALPFAQVERGPVCDDPEQMSDVLESLVGQTRRHGIMRLSVTPYWADDLKPRIERILKERGFSDVQSYTGSHVRALRLDLSSLSADAPFSGNEFTKLRKELRRSERAGATSRLGREEDVDKFRGMLEQRLRSEGRRAPTKPYYEALKDHFLSRESQSAMFVGEFEGDAVSAIFVTHHGSVAFFAAGASSARDLSFSKMVQPMASAVLWAKEQGSATFDFGGMPMQGDTDPKRNSIALFKRSFSRTEIALVHEHVRWL